MSKDLKLTAIENEDFRKGVDKAEIYPPLYDSPVVIDEDEIVNSNYCQWLETSNKTFIPSSKVKIYNNIPAGIYDIAIEKEQYVLKKQKIFLDELLQLPKEVFD